MNKEMYFLQCHKNDILSQVLSFNGYNKIAITVVTLCLDLNFIEDRKINIKLVVC